MSKITKSRRPFLRMENVRRTVQILAFLAFIYLFLVTVGQVAIAEKNGEMVPRLSLISGAPIDTFLRIDPLVAVSTMLAVRQVITILVIFALPVILLTMLFGRFFCGWLCPLGTTLDAADFLFWRKRSKRTKPWNPRNFKYYLLFAVLVGSLLTSQIAYFFDPICIITRSLTLVVFAPVQMVIRSISPGTQMTFLPEGQFFYRMNLLALLIFAGIIGLNSISRRFWCRNLCPLGALLALLSRFSIMRRIVGDCHECTKCANDCKMNSIQPNYQDYLAPECIYCYSCTRFCPAHDTKIIPATGKPGYIADYDLSRRRILQAVGIGVLSAGVLKTHASAKKSRESEIKSSSPQLIRPPGALPEDQFNNRCIRCSECMKVCPTNGLQPALAEAGLDGFWTPVLVPRIGECVQNCNLCSQVCSTQAIQPFEIEDKTYIFMGTAVIDRSACIAWNSDKPCLVCDEYCSYHALHWKTVDGVRRPFVDQKKCTGCGICESACPIQPQAAIRVFSFGDKRHMSREEQKRWSRRKFTVE